ncbi:PfkB family carbohydrate kinase [Streptomyces sp. NPDC060198]|uniref:PfkB family carbohydrate kinase n=1 Tax=Streptomyces sp. NPDC060198 TaxID=3347070 RepID=UPI0036613904
MTRITVLGSITMDPVAYAARAPVLGETVAGKEFRTVPGGKGAHQAVAAARAGGEVTRAGAVAADAYGSRLRGVLTSSGAGTALVRTAESAGGTAHVVVDDTGAEPIVVVPGANGTVTALGRVPKVAPSAGATFLGTPAVALGEGRLADKAVARASSAAALYVQKPGASTSMPYRSEIDAS